MISTYYYENLCNLEQLLLYKAAVDIKYLVALK